MPYCYRQIRRKR